MSSGGATQPFSRSLAQASTYRDRIKKATGHFVAVEDSFDSSTDTGKLLMRILLSFAEYELDTRRTAAKGAVAARIDGGRHWLRLLLVLAAALAADVTDGMRERELGQRHQSLREGCRRKTALLVAAGVLEKERDQASGAIRNLAASTKIAALDPQ